MISRKFIALAFILTGCASMPQGAENVHIVNGNYAFTASCKSLGAVSDSVSGWSFGTVDEAKTQVAWNLRAKAHNQFGADTLVIDGIDGFTTVSGSGTALKCNQ